MKRLLGRFLLWLGGWKPSGDPPPADKYVLIAAPHTTNWDGYWMIALIFYFDLPIKWVGKHTLFQGPLGWLMRWTGGLPVDRRSSNDAVAQLADRFAQHERIAITLAPEGTRSRRDHWKSGFYYLAKRANVPIALGFLDYEKCEGGFGGLLWPSDDPKADMDVIRAFYEQKTGRNPENSGPIRLRNEAPETVAP